MIERLDPAAALVAVGSRCTFDERQRADLAKILHDGPDWARVLALAEKNYVLPLVFESLRDDGLHALVPKDVQERLAMQRRFLRFRAQLFCDELVRIAGLLRDAGITVLHYKGPIAAERLYGDRFRRTYFDLDFLVRRTDLDDVSKLLVAEGYRASVEADQDAKDLIEREQKEYAFTSGLICIEPHWSLTARRYPFELDYESLWARSVVHDFGGTPLTTFCASDMLLILSMAGAKAHWKRLQMVTDVAQLYRSIDAADAADALERAREVGCERIMLVAAQLAAFLVDVTVPAPVRRRLDEDRRAVERICERVVTQLFSPRRRAGVFQDSPHMFSPLLFAMRERKRDKLLYLVRTATTPTSTHLRRFPLPAWAYPAYRVIVPVHDYALLPVVRALRNTRGSVRAG